MLPQNNLFFVKSILEIILHVLILLQKNVERFTSKLNAHRTFWNLHHHQSVLPKGRSFTASAGIKVTVLFIGRSFTANSGTKVAVVLEIDRCGSFLLLSAPHSLFSIWTDLKRLEKIPKAPIWRCGEWIWLTGPSGLHRYSPQGLNISSIKVFYEIRDLEIPTTLRSRNLHIKINLKIDIFGTSRSVPFNFFILCVFIEV